MSKKRQSVESGPIRVATYTRISTDEEHQPFSLEAQAEPLGSYVRSQDNWQLARRYTDQISGSTRERPARPQAVSPGARNATTSCPSIASTACPRPAVRPR